MYAGAHCRIGGYVALPAAFGFRVGHQAIEILCSLDHFLERGGTPSERYVMKEIEYVLQGVAQRKAPRQKMILGHSCLPLRPYPVAP
jgi:hypothetical protein